MGIRFTCPNGHKLNVKSNLAGRRGWCPHCGVPVEIPLQSTRESSHARRHGDAVEPPESLSNMQTTPGAQSTAYAGQPAANGSASPAGTVNGPAVSTAQPSTAQSASVQTTGYGGAASNVANVPASAPGASPAAMATVEAVLSEKPNAVWYLHQGESQRGPFLMDSMRDFFQNGQIESDAIVWREDWPDWRDVSEVFPALFPMAAPVSQAVSPAATAPVASAVQDFLQNTIQSERGLASPGMVQASKAGKKKLPIPINGVTALCIFAVSLLMLGAGACWMLTRGGEEAESTTVDSVQEAPAEPAKSAESANQNEAPAADAPADTSTTVQPDTASATAGPVTAK